MPSSEVLAAQGVQAVQDGDYNQAIEKLTEALKDRPAPLWLLERSKAHLRTGDFDLALYDAVKGLHVALGRANRDHMVEAQIRRAVTYFRMGRFADADICAFWAIRLLEQAKASEDDGQQNRVDANGDYDVKIDEVTSQNQPASKQDAMAQAMGGGSGRTKETRQKNTASSWRVQALTQLQTLPPGHPGRKVGVGAKYPTPDAEPPSKKTNTGSTSAPAQSGPATSQDKATTAASATAGSDDASSWDALWSQYQPLHIQQGIRSSYYQSDTTLNIDFFVKNVPKDELKVDAQPQSITLGPIPGTLSEQIHLSLFDKIVPSETKHTVKSMKIELVLKKETPGKWPSLQRSKAAVADNAALGAKPEYDHFHSLITQSSFQQPKDLGLDFQGDEKTWYLGLNRKLREAVESSTESADKPRPTVAPATKAATPSAAPSGTSSAPAYPTSSKKGPMNWDSIKDDEDDKKDEDINSFFQSIYKNADEDTKRAMMKSYVESNGTSLSTNWSEAKEKKYETLPPDGSEAKKW